MKPIGPFVHEDENDEDAKDGPSSRADKPACKGEANSLPNRSAPLRSISSNASSGKPATSDEPEEKQENESHVASKHIRTSSNNAEGFTATENEDDVSPVNQVDQPPSRGHADWTADLASLVEQQQRRTNSSEHHQPAERLKHRKLGRAASGSSFGTRTTTGSTTANNDQGVTEASFSESSEQAAGAGSFPSAPEGLPSTQLGYETPEAEAARQQIAKRMGTSYADEGVGTRLASLGTVRDSSAAANATGGRSRNRTRR